ncbi:Hypothetical protein CINCED_3A005433 [Cinara cedri]|nr:Hypothetical protein CINCED_3A005433 [Cinara cedri]
MEMLSNGYGCIKKCSKTLKQSVFDWVLHKFNSLLTRTMSNIPTASTSTASTSSASTSLALPSTSTSQLHPYTFRQEVEYTTTTTDDSEMSSDDDYKIYEEHSSNSNSNPIESNNSDQFVPSIISSDDISWSSIGSSDVSLSCEDENSSSDDNIHILNELLIKPDEPNNETLENPPESASHTSWTESTPTNEDSNEAKCSDIDDQKIPMLLLLEIDELANYMINLEEHDGRLLELEKETEYINVTAWMYRPLDPTIR